MKFQSEIIKQEAHKQGFDLCGIAKAESLTVEKERFEKALVQNFHAKKPYLEQNIDKRFHPELLLENCKSVVVCGFNYNTRIPKPEIRISQYAQIKNYHVFMKKKLKTLALVLQEKYGSFNYKTTVDSSAISEKAWAVQAGIGYYGKNGIIQTKLGSFIFLGILLLDKEVEQYDTPNQDSCGNCSKCIAECPTKAIAAPYYVDCNRCISHILQTETDFSRVEKFGWHLACDACQDVCPNNANAPINQEAIELRVYR